MTSSAARSCQPSWTSRVIGGVLVQATETSARTTAQMQVVAGKVKRRQWPDVARPTVAKHVDSNAIVLARDGQTLGIGAAR